MARSLPTDRYKTETKVDAELGIERRCFACGEWWPQDAEFWYFDRAGQVMGRCRACWSDRRRDAGL